MKRKMKKVLSVFTAAAMCLSLAACGSSKTEESTVAAATSAAEVSKEVTETEDNKVQEPITLRVAWWGGDSRHEAILKAIELYEQKNPGVKIEGEYQGYDGYYEKMMTTLSSGTAPDLFQFHRDWIPDVQGAKHYLADLSELPVDTTTLKEGVLEEAGMYNGEPVFFSATVGGTAMFVNTDFAAKYGLDVSKQYTWDEFMELGKQIHEQDPESYLMTADIDVLNRLIILGAIAQQTGGSLINEDTYELNFTEEQMTQALQLILDLYETNTLEPFGEAAVFVGQMEQNNKWVNGKIGVLMDVTRKDVIQEVIYGDVTPEEGAKEIVEQYTEIMNNIKE